MNLEKVFFSAFILLALTLNFGFVMGDIDNPDHHHPMELFAALTVSLIATVLKLGDRTHIGAVLLATSIVADIQLLAATLVWGMALYILDYGTTASVISTVVSLSGGALLANIASVVLLMIETVTLRR
ncbi:MAG: hypothetical protein H6970_02440 [Gammaproteobacteria bacterium]|nr:hypothetical protein [Gammaproteobacteria bacterium]MCP5423916.1 hypothetical protein [Gammaproteobacteria bacterium]MCP5459395.1 hypothetical protein [Gammaproteobacteria bacterium]